MSDPEPMDEQPGGSSWEEVTDEQGTYYFNSSTGETAWENPEAAPATFAVEVCIRKVRSMSFGESSARNPQATNMLDWRVAPAPL